MIRQPVAQDARDDVVGPAGREAHHELHRAIGVFVLRKRRDDRSTDQAKQGDAQSNDAHGIPPFDLAVMTLANCPSLWSVWISLFCFFSALAAPQTPLCSPPPCGEG